MRGPVSYWEGPKNKDLGFRDHCIFFLYIVAPESMEIAKSVNWPRVY